MLAPKNSHFFPNFLFFSGPQLLMLAFVLLFRPRAPVVAGIAFSLALYLGLFGAWVFTRTHPESMAWLGYMFSLPGGVVGAVLAAVLSRKRPDLGSLAAGLAAAALVAAGIIVNQVVVCSTFMYCGGK
jgi:ABC-type sulfate transport system permease component